MPGISSVQTARVHTRSIISRTTGTVHADGFAGFNGLFGEGKADEQACMVHVRRKFVEEFERTGRPSPKARSSRSPCFMLSKSKSETNPLKSVSPCDRPRQNPCLMSWKPGYRPSFPGSRARTGWQGPFAMRGTACQRRLPVSATDGWNSTTTSVNARSAPSHWGTGALGRENHLFMGSGGGGGGKAAAIAYTRPLHNSGFRQIYAFGILV